MWDLIEIIQERLRSNKNCLIAIVGEVGSGKSYSAIRIAERVDPSFSIEKICFSSSEFISAIRKSREGEAIIYDEAGVGISNREWWSIQNRLIDYVIQTFRFKNLCVIFTMPNLFFIDEHVRLLFHFILETQKINQQHEVVILKIFQVKTYSRFRSKTYFQYPRCKNKIIKQIYIQKPSDLIIKQYEEKKKKYLENLYQEILEILGKKEKKEEKINIEDEIITYFKENEDILSNFKNKSDLAIYIKRKWNIGFARAKAIASSIFRENEKEKEICEKFFSIFPSICEKKGGGDS